MAKLLKLGMIKPKQSLKAHNSIILAIFQKAIAHYFTFKTVAYTDSVNINKKLWYPFSLFSVIFAENYQSLAKNEGINSIL